MALEYNSPFICGLKKYNYIDVTRTSVNPPVILTILEFDPFITMIPSVSLNNLDPWTIRVSTNNLNLIGTYMVKLIGTFIDYPLATVTPASITFKLSILHPCTISKIIPPVIPELEFIIGDPATIFDFS